MDKFAPKSPSRPRFILTCSLAALITGTASRSRAANDNWIGGTSTDYNNPANWSLGVVPSESGGNEADINTNTGNIATLSSGTDTAGSDIVVGRGSNGQLNQTGGSLSTASNGGWFFVGDGGGNGTFNLANTAATGGTLTGYGQGTGSVNTNGGRFYVGSGSSNAAGTSVANVNTSGSIMVGGQFLVAESNGVKGVLNVDGGTISMATDFYLGGGNTGTTGTLNLGGGTITRTGGWSFVGGDLNGSGGATGTINISGGTLDESAGGDTLFGRGTGSVGNLNMTGGTFAGGTLHFGENANTVGNGNDGAGSSAATLSGSAALSSTGNLIVADGTGATGAFTANGNSTVAVGGELWIGQQSTNNNTFTLNSGAVTVSSWVAVGRDAGTGTLNLNGGTFTKTANGNGYFEVASYNGSTGTVNLNGGTLAVDKIITEGASSTFNFNGGTLQAIGDGTRNFNGNTTFLQGLTTANVRNGGAIINTNGFNITVAQPLLHSSIAGDNATDGGLVKNGTGTLTLSGVNTFNGNVTLNQGVVAAANNNAFGTVNTVNQANPGIGGSGGRLTGVQLTGGITVPAGVSFSVSNDGTGTVPYALDSVGSNTVLGTVTLVNGGGNSVLQAEAGGTLTLANLTTGTGTRTALLSGAGNGNVAGVVSNGAGTTAITLQGSGTWTLSSANTYTGATAVNSGTLALGATNAAPATSGVAVNSTGTLLLSANNALATPAASTGVGNAAPGTTAAMQVPATLSGGTLLRNGTGVNLGTGTTVGGGALTLTANSTLDFGTTGVGTLNFNGFAPGSSTLTVSDYSRVTSTSTAGVDGTDDRLIFNQRLNAAQLTDITFAGTGAREFALGNGEFEVVPVPEPAAVFGGLLLLGALGLNQRRRVGAWLRLPRPA